MPCISTTGSPSPCSRTKLRTPPASNSRPAARCCSIASVTARRTGASWQRSGRLRSRLLDALLALRSLRELLLALLHGRRGIEPRGDRGRGSGRRLTYGRGNAGIGAIQRQTDVVDIAVVVGVAVDAEALRLGDDLDLPGGGGKSDRSCIQGQLGLVGAISDQGAVEVEPALRSADTVQRLDLHLAVIAIRLIAAE